MINLCAVISGSGLRDEVNVNVTERTRRFKTFLHGRRDTEWMNSTSVQCELLVCWCSDWFTQECFTHWVCKPTFYIENDTTGLIAACSQPLQSIFVLYSADPRRGKHPKSSNSLAKLQKVTCWRASSEVFLTFLLTFIIDVTVRWSHTCIVFLLRHHSARQWLEHQSSRSSMKSISAVTLLNIDTVAWLTFSGSIKTQRPTPAVHPAHPHVSSVCQLGSRLGMKSSYSCWAPAADWVFCRCVQL